MTDYAAARVAMVDNQVRPSDVTSYPIIDAMLSVPREAYAPGPLREVAYAGEHLPLGPGRVMLDPRTFAKMIEFSDVGPDDLVLDIGCGLGYSTAVLARLAAAVIAVEADPDMARAARSALVEHEVDNAEVIEGPMAEGAKDHAPYNVIFVQGGVEEIPEGLVAQLREGGRLIAIRMSGAYGRCEVLTRTAAGASSWRAFDAAAPVLEGFEKAAVFEF
ncbi:protein-L-isoaspartate O-methyltransferase [Albimonas sp. CAU 1670]|uniref:protein-L-isoaspartate O-methyltransferase family protein n=1 Tax=Albimonas sp. CAU 1670 TaxID=3032599 RepID=UPI0023D97C44|nr:protein-L-isoaspartate O-methyltransferase [Albimonas sp. CAU 1670]MDF2232784.1 protein-L-isoaspartate O-methyltransferase [Albimonas sp. CAU 1670]